MRPSRPTPNFIHLRFDRFRLELKGTWKDLPLEANGLTYDLAAHTIDQVLILFGRPAKITAFIENIRGLGSKEVDDAVSHPLMLRCMLTNMRSGTRSSRFICTTRPVPRRLGSSQRHSQRFCVATSSPCAHRKSATSCAARTGRSSSLVLTSRRISSESSPALQESCKTRRTASSRKTSGEPWRTSVQMARSSSPRMCYDEFHWDRMLC